MDLIADILLVAGALGAGLYCFVLARRLTRFNDLETGVGGAVAVLSAQVDDLTKTLMSAQKTAGASTETLEQLTDRAEGVAKRLELLVASMHDLPDPAKAADQVRTPNEPDLFPTGVQDGPATFAAQPRPEPPASEPVFMRHDRPSRAGAR